MKSRKQIDHEMQPRKRTTLGWWYRLGILCLLLAATAIALPAQTLTTMVNFDGTNGSYPFFAPVQGGDGNLYGIATGGGPGGDGTVFKMTPTGTLTTLYSFCAQTNCTDGAGPNGPMLATDGNFYGTATGGGAYGLGTVFNITPGGTLTTLHSFDGTDGSGSDAGLVQATDGNFYGTTTWGGTSDVGTIFKMTRGGTLTTLYSFCSLTNCLDGEYPYTGSLVQGRDGNFYGTTESGGTGAACGTGLGCGTVFKITPQGILTTLYSFCSQTNCVDGWSPWAGLIEATPGNFYGTTNEGGAYGSGTVFKITSQGSLTTLHSFCPPGYCADGGYPYAGLIQATDGDLYGTTIYGGAYTGGTIFKINLSGKLTVLYRFCEQGRSCTDGTTAVGLVQATDGNFYGVTETGGTNNLGTIFSLSVGLGPFVETLPTLGPVEAPVRILGTSLTGTTSVMFNGTAATFTVSSTGTAINTTVPSGATTGIVQVVTPGGTLSSNVPFRVRH